MLPITGNVDRTKYFTPNRIFGVWFVYSWFIHKTKDFSVTIFNFFNVHVKFDLG